MIILLRLAVCVVAALCTPFLIAAQTGPDPAHSSKGFALVADTSLSFTETELYGFVGTALDPTVIFSIATGPGHGSLDPHPMERLTWIYTPDPGFFGRDVFTYSLDGESYQAWFHVAPSKSPIAGRWPTEYCYPGKEGESDFCGTHWIAGHGSELGWFDAVEETFHLCDWQYYEVIECVVLEVPGSGAFQTWTPLALDREGDGWHELALRDPLTAKMIIFRILPSLDSKRPGSLATIEEWILGEPGDLPVTGNWAGDEVSEFGVYRFIDQDNGVYGQLWLEDGLGDQFSHGLGSSIAWPWPMAGNWLREGEDQIGVFDLDLRVLRLARVVGGDVQSIQASDRGSSSSVPFVSPVSNGDDEVVLIAFDGDEGPHGVFHVFRYDYSFRDPLPLEVRVDPSGRPLPPPY